MAGVLATAAPGFDDCNAVFGCRGGGSRVRRDGCCPNGANTFCGETCWPRPKVCVDWCCRCATNGNAPCGDRCCPAQTPVRADPKRGTCCQEGTECGDTCRSLFEVCSDAQAGVCCLTSQVVCNGSCCESTQVCDGGSCRCPSGEVTSGGICCPVGMVCRDGDRDFDCRPDGRGG